MNKRQRKKWFRSQRPLQVLRQTTDYWFLTRRAGWWTLMDILIHHGDVGIVLNKGDAIEWQGDSPIFTMKHTGAHPGSMAYLVSSHNRTTKAREDRKRRQAKRSPAEILEEAVWC